MLHREALESLRRLDGGEGRILRKTIDLFRDMAPRNFAGIAAALAVGEAENVQRLAHNLKAASGTLGGKAMMVLCAELERAAENGALVEAAALLKMVRAQFDLLEPELVSEIAEDA